MMPWCANPGHPCSNGATSNRLSLPVRWAGICDSPFPIGTVEELLTERGIPADHTTIWRWVQCYAPELHKRCRRELRPTNGSWRVDETYVRVKAKWVYSYRTVDFSGLRLIFCSASTVPLLPPSASSRKHCMLLATRAQGDQCGRQPVIPQGGRGTEDRRKTGPAMSLSHLSLLEQHRGTGPPGNQTAS